DDHAPLLTDYLTRRPHSTNAEASFAILKFAAPVAKPPERSGLLGIACLLGSLRLVMAMMLMGLLLHTTRSSLSTVRSRCCRVLRRLRRRLGLRIGNTTHRHRNTDSSYRQHRTLHRLSP